MPRIPLDVFASHTRTLTINKWPTHVDPRERAFVTARLRRSLHPIAALTACAEGQRYDPFEVTLVYPDGDLKEIITLRLYFSHQTSDRAPQIWWAGSAGIRLSDWISPRALRVDFKCTTGTTKNALVLVMTIEAPSKPVAAPRVKYPLPSYPILYDPRPELPPVHAYADQFFRLRVPSEFGGLCPVSALQLAGYEQHQFTSERYWRTALEWALWICGVTESAFVAGPTAYPQVLAQAVGHFTWACNYAYDESAAGAGNPNEQGFFESEQFSDLRTLVASSREPLQALQAGDCEDAARSIAVCACSLADAPSFESPGVYALQKLARLYTPLIVDAVTTDSSPTFQGVAKARPQLDVSGLISELQRNKSGSLHQLAMLVPRVDLEAMTRRLSSPLGDGQVASLKLPRLGLEGTVWATTDQRFPLAARARACLEHLSKNREEAPLVRTLLATARAPLDFDHLFPSFYRLFTLAYSPWHWKRGQNATFVFTEDEKHYGIHPLALSQPLKLIPMADDGPDAEIADYIPPTPPIEPAEQPNAPFPPINNATPIRFALPYVLRDVDKAKVRVRELLARHFVVQGEWSGKVARGMGVWVLLLA